MARIGRDVRGPLVIAETDSERDLLHFGRTRGGEVVLLEGLYPVRGNALVLPESLSLRGARRVCLALQQAAGAHQEAQRRRRKFLLIKG